MNTVRWRDGWRDVELCAWRHKDDRGSGWTVVRVDGELRARGLLARCTEAHKLRALLVDDPAWTPWQLDDAQVLDHLARLLAAGRLLLRTTHAAPHGTATGAAGGAAPAAARLRSAAAASPRGAADAPSRISPRGWAARRTSAAPPAPAPRPSPTPPPAAAPTYWVEIQLLGEDDKPIADVDYRLELPDKTIVTGRLDGAGLARHDGLAQGGDCRICFPQLDKDAWSFIRTETA